MSAVELADQDVAQAPQQQNQGDAPVAKKRGRDYDYWIVYAESHLLAAAVPSIIFPVSAFIGACIQVRYKTDYLTCLANYAKVEGNKVVTVADDKLLINLRLIQSLMYAYSISYFFLLVQQEGNRVFNIVNAVVFSLINLAILGTGIFGFIAVGTSVCPGVGYGPVLWFLNTIGIIFSIFEIGFSLFLFLSFRSSGKLPCFGADKPMEQQNAASSSNQV